MRYGFDPRLRPVSRADMVRQLLEGLRAAAELGFDVIELSLTERMLELGLRTVFSGELLELMDRAPVRFHLHILPPEDRWPESGIAHPTPYPRSVELRRLVHIVEFFEAQHPMQLYLVHAGPAQAAFATHLEALRRSMGALETLYPGLPLALVNETHGGVLQRAPDLLDLLEALPNLRFVFDTGLAYEAVDHNREAYAWLLRSIERFEDRLAEIHWSNAGPGVGAQRPLHLQSHRGVDIPRTLRLIGRNPAVVHLFSTVGANVAALAKEKRLLYQAVRA